MSGSFFEKVSLKKFKREKIISEHTAQGRFELIFVLDHLKPGFNVAKIFRSANIFGVKEVLLVGIDHFDVRAAMGGFKHTHSKSFEKISDCFEYLKEQDYSIYSLSPTQAQPLPHYPLSKKTAFVVGHEEFGLSFKPEEYPFVKALTIPQFGDVQSLNASVAASIAGYEYLRQHAYSKTPEVIP